MQDDSMIISLIKTGDLEALAKELDKDRYLLTTVIDRKYSGTLLHVSAKYDTKNMTNITHWLLNNYEISPNILNSGESLPLYWALEQANIEEDPNFEPFKLLLFHKNSELFLKSNSRDSPYNFIRRFYCGHKHFPYVQQLLKEKIWNNRKSIIYVYLSLNRHSLLK